MATQDPYTCTGLALAREAVQAAGMVSDTTIDAQLRIGPSFARPIPGDVTRAIEVAAALLNVALEHDPRLLDHPPIVETAFGPIPLRRSERCRAMEEWARVPLEADGGMANQRLRAAAALEKRLAAIEELFRLRREVIWKALRDAEWSACDLLARYLTGNLMMARMERARYLYPGTATPYATSDDFKGLQAAIRRVAAARRAIDLDAIEREQTVVECVALALTVDAIARSIQRLDFAMDDKTWQEVGYASGLADQARLHTAEATARYLRVLREEATRYPIILVLNPRSLEQRSALPVGEAIDAALRKAEKAIGDIFELGVNGETFRAYRTADDITPSGMAEKMAEAPRKSVWKLPFFMERTLLNAPTDRANIVRRMLRHAADVESGNDIKNGLALFGMDTAMMGAAATGFVGVALAFVWAVFTLGKSIHDYEQLSDLYEASIDPAVLLLDEQHGPPSAMWIFFDVLGLWV